MSFSNLARLRARLAVIIALALAPAGVLAIVQAVNAVGIAANQQTDLLEAQALNAIDAERALLIEIRQVLRAAAKEVEQTADTRISCPPEITELTARHQWMLDAFLLNKEGMSTCSADAELNVGGLQGWSAFTIFSGFTLSAIRIEEDSGKSSLLAYYPLQSATDDIAAIGVSIDLSRFQAIAALSGGNLDVALLDRAGEVITANDADDARWLPSDRSQLQVFGDRRLRDADSRGKDQNYFVSSLVPGQLWAVINNRPQGVWTSLGTFAGLSILAPIAIWLIAVIVAYYAVDLLVTRHIAALRRAALRIGEGDLDTPVGDFREAPSELKALAGAIRAMRDKIAERETELTRTLELQRRLLLEIHHRVKNNLQTISSLMNLESGRISSSEAKAAIGAIQARVHSLAMVHQNLYAAENLEEVALDQLTRDIASHLEDSLSLPGDDGITSMELDPVVAPTNLATPISLFLSEALGNAFKHAGAPPDIRLILRTDDRQFLMSISNRMGDSAPQTAPEEGRLGLELMRGFAKQVGGEFASGETDDGRFEVALTVPLGGAKELFAVRRG